MRLVDDVLTLTATDLSAHSACVHLTELRLREKLDGGQKEPRDSGPGTDALAERGRIHEAAYLVHLREQGFDVLDVSKQKETQTEQTLKAINAGQDVIAQAKFQADTWGGIADVLIRNANGTYDIIDTKLARETRGTTILQLLVYAELLSELTGKPVERVGVVAPDTDFEPEWHRVTDYDAYYRLAKGRLLEAIKQRPTDTYPEPCEHCQLCNWWKICGDKRHADDHLSLVASLTGGQQREIESNGLETLEAFAEHKLWKPERGTRASLESRHNQAKIQLRGRREKRYLYELLIPCEGKGFELLPAPDDADIFFDIEGDRFAGTDGLEYLFGTVDCSAVFKDRWAYNSSEERTMLDAFMEEMVAITKANPGAHIYHFGHYEPSALKRLAQAHGTKEFELDELLRGGRFVDLLRVVKTALIASVESYSIKELEPLYEFVRQEDLEESRVNRRELELRLESGDTKQLDVEMMRSIADYNREDCESTLFLRDWLESIRPHGTPRFALPEVEEPKPRDPELQLVIEKLLHEVPTDPAERTADDQTRATLAALTEYYRREARNGWWEYFSAFEIEEHAERLDKANVLCGLKFIEALAPEGRKRKYRMRFSYPEQRFDENGSAGLDSNTSWSMEVDKENREVAFPVDEDELEMRPDFVVAKPFQGGKAKEKALLELATTVANNGLDSCGYLSARALLRREAPRFVKGPRDCLRDEKLSLMDNAIELARSLDSGVLAIQGPPGTGKTHTGAHIIRNLVALGKRVGVCALSHAAIQNLLDAIVEEKPNEPRVAHVGGDQDDAPDSKQAPALLDDGQIQVLGATPYYWASTTARNIDVLVVDEAGQLALADTLAASMAADRVILLGDPQQLESPQQGSHPEHAGLAALAHFIGHHDTISNERGLLLDETYRLSKSIADFTSTLFYEGRLKVANDLIADQHLIGSRFDGAGLYTVAVQHEGNQSDSPEEVDAVKTLVKQLLAGDVRWVDKNGEERDLKLNDVLVVAPYNAQVAALRAALPEGARVGTVDKFQGQEAPVVIISMATSTPELAPRGMNFLYSRNRLNVATSRARTAAILVCNPALLSPECQTPHQMRLANAFAAFAERSLKP